MEWRCAWCGKPHAENDPPCDNCGHGEFEKAVVPMAPESDDTDGESMTVWVCAECGNDHPKHTPPCDRCGGGPLERQEVDYDEEAVMSEMLSDGRSVPSADVSYLDVLDTKLVLGFVGVGALVVVLALGFTGIVDVPFLPGPDGPVPGNDTSVDGLSLSTVEEAYLEELNDQREAEGYEPLTADEDLASVATYLNSERLRRDYGSSDGVDGEELQNRLSDVCGDSDRHPIVFTVTSELGQGGESGYDSERDLARALVDGYRNSADSPSQFADPDDGRFGIDVHVAPDGTIYVVHFAC